MVVCEVYYCFAMCFVTVVVFIVVMLVFISCSGLVLMFVVYLVLLNVACFLSSFIFCRIWGE